MDLTSDHTLPRGSPPPHSLQQTTNLLWCVDEIVMVKPDLAPCSSAKSGKVPKSGKDNTRPFDVGPIATSHSQSGDMHEWPGPNQKDYALCFVVAYP